MENEDDKKALAENQTPKQSKDSFIFLSKIPFSRNTIIIFTVALVAILLGSVTYYLNMSEENAMVSPTPTPSHVSTASPTPTNSKIQTSDELSPIMPKSNLSPTSTSTPVPTSTSTPVPRPPEVEVSYPKDGDTIKFSYESPVCVILDSETYTGPGYKSRYNLNNSGWTVYSSSVTPCFKPAEGSNTFQIQFRNDYAEGQVISRNFVFHNP